MPGAEAAGGTEATARLLVRLGAKLEPPKAIELELSNGIPSCPRTLFAWQDRAREFVRYVIRNGGDAASPNSRVTPEALALRERLVDEFEAAAARFAVGDAVVLQNVSATYNGLVGTIAGPINSKLSFPVGLGAAAEDQRQELEPRRGGGHHELLECECNIRKYLGGFSKGGER